MNQKDIQIALQKCKTEFIVLMNSLDEEAFRYKITDDKWNAAEQLYHLITSAKSSTLPYNLPAFALKILFGKVTREANTLESLEQLYTSKLNKGAKASGKYALVDKVKFIDKNNLISQFEKTYDIYTYAFTKCSEKKLDICGVPHPILGKISLRELAYFTIFHTNHHIDSIQRSII